MKQPDPPGNARKASGAAAEQAAASLLERLGHRVLARNLRLGHLEIDVLSTDPSDGALVLTEVKGRRRGRHAPELRVDRRKRMHLETAARMLLRRPEFRRRPIRFDVVAVLLDAEGRPEALRHVPRAFDVEGRRPGQ
jgi:putative endonuclease